MKKFFELLKTFYGIFNPTQTTPDLPKQERAEIYKQLCLVSDKIATARLQTGFIKGYSVIHSEFDPKTNFKAVTYENSTEIVNCFVGTDAKNLKDQRTNLRMGFKITTDQMIQAKNYAQKVMQTLGKSKIIINTGHSEGGTEALYAGLCLNLEVFTFNPFCLNKSVIHLLKDKIKNGIPRITNYRTPQDLVSKLFNNDLGETYIIGCTKKCPTQAHKLSNMANCKTAIPLSEYKKTHPFFVDKIKLTGH